jgi:cystathionine beta-lyase
MQEPGVRGRISSIAATPWFKLGDISPGGFPGRNLSTVKGGVILGCFDKVVKRRGTGCAKWDGHGQMGAPLDALPLWVADMDFEIMPEVTRAISERTAHAVYGYPLPSDSYYRSIQTWIQRRYNWQVEAQWIQPVPGVVPALNLAIHAFTQAGDAVLIQPPVYPPFANAVAGNGRKLVTNPLVPREDGYGIDFQDFEEKIAANSVKLFILCSPHNPVGRVWTPEELRQMADICVRHNVLIVSDEIHQDLTFPGVRHYPLPSLDPAYQEITLVCTAPSKSFNLAGLQASNIIIANPRLREKFQAAARCWGLSKVNCIGMVACEAAYTHGRQWLDEAMAYIAANRDFVREYLEEHLPQIKLTKSQGLYLLWLDFNSLGLSPEELEKFLLHRAKLWLNQGYTFGEEGRGFARLNIACPRSQLKTALDQLKAAIGDGS